MSIQRSYLKLKLKVVTRRQAVLKGSDSRGVSKQLSDLETELKHWNRSGLCRCLSRHEGPSLQKIHPKC